LSYQGILDIGSIDPENVEDQIHFQVYQLLRGRIQEHLEKQGLPILHLLTKPVGPWEWLRQQEQSAQEEIQNDPDLASEDQEYEDVVPVAVNDEN
jgi:hypothetical protein